MPVFNERDSVILLVHEIISALRDRTSSEGGDFETVYVDGHSRDDTLRSCVH
jgi:glycosyltransferase involved in cell wall biosynthesis